MSIYKNDVKYEIAQKLFEYYVMNDKYVAVQMPDGKYIPKRITSTPVLFQNMMESGSSLGVYQQQYGRKWIKWICLDFDCKEPYMLPDLVSKYVLPAVIKLKEMGIHYLAEFSGRRGIHIWIFTKGIITKAQGFKIAEKLTESYRDSIRCETKYGLDLFPAVAGGGMKLGKQVKLPLSVHRKGGQSFFIPDILKSNYQEWINLPKHPEFWEIQLKILQECVLNSPEELWEKLKLLPDQEQREKALLYKKEYVISGKKLSLEEMKKNCTECSVFSAVLQRALDGNLKYLDRLILVGCLGHFQDRELILDIMKQQKNYKEEVTKQYLSKLGKSYYPVTIQYMYDLYGEKPEPHLNPQMTILEYIADKFGFRVHIQQNLYEEKQIQNQKDIDYFRMIRDKELRYMKYDDEVLSVNDYLQMLEMKQYDFQCILEQFKGIIAGEKTEPDIPVKFSVYQRLEEGKKKPRTLVTLCPAERILTTALIYELVETMGRRMHSYSYNLNFFYESGSVFMPWYDSWKRFQKDVESYLYLDIFKSYGLIKLDLSDFYDSIYVQAVFQQMQQLDSISRTEEVGKKINNIMSYLGSYTEKLMEQIKGKIRGVPQGPAYARVFAELFLTAVIDSFYHVFGYSEDVFQCLRYVDDMFIIYHGIDGEELLKQFSDYLFDRGLSINRDKTFCFEQISDMKESDKRSIFEDGEANYEIKGIQELELEDEEQREEKLLEFEKYLNRKGKWTIRDANFILNRYLDPLFVEEYLNKYAESLIKQTVGRGSIYKRLYEEILKRDEWLVRFFKGNMYCEIPEESVNFQNFISVCYFNISRVQFLEKTEKVAFVQWLKNGRKMSQNDMGTAHAIIRLLEEEL